MAGFAVAAAEPRSAIPWLSESLRAVSVEAPRPGPAAEDRRAPAPDDLATGPAGPAPSSPDAPIRASLLAPRSENGTGLLSPGVTGLPADLWGPTSELRARSLLTRVKGTGVPAAQELYRTLLLASTWPPQGSGIAADLLRLRVDRLMQMGALDEALELITASGIETPDFLQRRFDIALLTGQADQACVDLLARRDVEPTAIARIFCLARGNAWTEAVVTFAVAREAGDITPVEETLVSRFLGIEEPVPGEVIALPERVTPLTNLMLSAIGAGGEAASEQGFPAAFLAPDLAPSAPPRARILAAEHLVATGGAAFPILFYAYRADTPAASGGAWSRAAAVQDLDAALAGSDPAAIGRSVAEADRLLADIGLRVAFACEYAPQLASLAVGAGPEAERMVALLLLGGETAAAARWFQPAMPQRYQAALAVATRGDPDPAIGSEDAVRRAFARTAPDETVYLELAALLTERKVGEALLRALQILDARTAVEPQDLAAALRIIAEAGQEETARRIATETLLMFEDG